MLELDWRAVTPDFIEEYVDDLDLDLDLSELVPDDVDFDLDIQIPNVAEAPLELLRAGIEEVGDVLEIPGDTLEAMLEEAGDSRDALGELFRELVDEAGQSRDSVLTLITRAIEEAAGVGSNLALAFVVANLAFGTLLVAAAGAALYFGGSKVDLVASLAKLGR